jgi:hypothetical protein
MPVPLIRSVGSRFLIGSKAAPNHAIKPANKPANNRVAFPPTQARRKPYGGSRKAHGSRKARLNRRATRRR